MRLGWRGWVEGEVAKGGGHAASRCGRRGAPSTSPAASAATRAASKSPKCARSSSTSAGSLGCFTLDVACAKGAVGGARRGERLS